MYNLAALVTLLFYIEVPKYEHGYIIGTTIKEEVIVAKGVLEEVGTVDEVKASELNSNASISWWGLIAAHLFAFLFQIS